MDYKKVKEDFESGVLDKDNDVLVLDNDGCWLQSNDSSLSDDEREAKYLEYHKTYGRGAGQLDLSEIATAGGIPNEWC